MELLNAAVGMMNDSIESSGFHFGTLVVEVVKRTGNYVGMPSLAEGDVTKYAVLQIALPLSGLVTCKLVTREL